MSNTILAKMPFSGTYYTIWDSSNFLPYDDDGNQVELDIDFKKYLDYLGKEYTTHFSTLLSELLEFPVILEFVKTTSPREYNFHTDCIFATIDIDVLEQIRAITHNNNYKFSEFLRNNFRSRSGFISFYSYDVASWQSKLTSDLDTVEIWAYLEFICNFFYENTYRDIESDIYDEIHEKLENFVEDNGTVV